MLTALERVVVAATDLEAATASARALLGRAPSWRGATRVRFRLENTALEVTGAPGAQAGLRALVFRTDDAEAPDLPPTVTRGVDLRITAAGESRALVSAPDAEPRAVVAALDHVVVASPDAEAARVLYGDTLGLRLALDRRFPARRQRILFFRVGGATVEVVAPAEPDARADGPDRLWGLAWRAPDVEAARRRVAAAGFDVSGVRPGAKPGTSVCTVRGEPLGVATLLIGPAS